MYVGENVMPPGFSTVPKHTEHDGYRLFPLSGIMKYIDPALEEPAHTRAHVLKGMGARCVRMHWHKGHACAGLGRKASGANAGMCAGPDLHIPQMRAHTPAGICGSVSGGRGHARVEL